MFRFSRPVRSMVVACAVMLAGCAGGGSGGAQARPAGGSATRIVEAELTELHQLSALEAIQRLRAGWLTTRTGASPMVHIDGNIQQEGRQALATLRAADVQEMRYLNAADATTRFGTNYVSGVILVTTKR